MGRQHAMKNTFTCWCDHLKEFIQHSWCQIVHFVSKSEVKAFPIKWSCPLQASTCNDKFTHVCRRNLLKYFMARLWSWTNIIYALLKKIKGTRLLYQGNIRLVDANSTSSKKVWKKEGCYCSFSPRLFGVSGTYTLMIMRCHGLLSLLSEPLLNTFFYLLSFSVTLSANDKSLHLPKWLVYAILAPYPRSWLSHFSPLTLCF